MLRNLCCCVFTSRSRDDSDQDSSLDLYDEAPPQNHARDGERGRFVLGNHQRGGAASGRSGRNPSLLSDSHRSDGAHEGDDDLDEHRRSHERCVSAPPRDLGAFYAIDGEDDDAGAFEKATEKEMARAKAADSSEVTRNGNGRHRRARSVVSADVDETAVIEVMKKEFARLKSLERAPSTRTSKMESDDYDDTCPTCFDGYEEENPRMTLRCGHHFHLACILEWQEYLAAHGREDTCPCCDRPIETEVWMD
ncbi:hypothetical protein BE221DRAFT_12208 [Ostreococcus tauri]|uniref:RING-type E3 ubiquitin transferase n=1 Tax=Ostreococcus tauri TaxID=70448 RepID=A0A1Y5IG99_OSTTA|nr:hypothetical protein BE221DRAFT_12208 [Ostreococcus tauri]